MSTEYDWYAPRTRALLSVKTTDRAAALDEMLAAAEERGRLQGQFSPLGDNHHNAAACPYCGDLLTKAEERGRRRGVEGRDELLGSARDWLEFMAAHPGEGDAKNLIAIIDAALAPRDSAPGRCTCNPPLVDGHWSTCALGKPRDSGKEGP